MEEFRPAEEEDPEEASACEPEEDIPVLERPRGRGFGCRLGNLRHLLLTTEPPPERVAYAVRRIPGLERYLLAGANRSQTLRPYAGLEDLFQRWGRRRLEQAIAVFEHRVFDRRSESRDATG